MCDNTNKQYRACGSCGNRLNVIGGKVEPCPYCSPITSVGTAVAFDQRLEVFVPYMADAHERLYN